MNFQHYYQLDFSNKELIQKELQTMIFNNHKETVTELIADHLKKQHFFKSIRNDKDREIWVYKEGIYLPEGASYIFEETRNLIGYKFTTYLGNQVIAKVWSDTFIEQQEFFNQQHNHPYHIPINNGLLNLKTKELEPYTPEKYFFTKLNLTYDPKKECPNIIKFIKQIVPRYEDVKTIQEIFGFSLIKDYKFEKGFMFYGERGRNGKSKLLSLLETFVNKSNCANISLQEIEKEPFCLINLHNKLVNISADISNQAINSTGVYKSLTGRDTINANRKGRSYVQFLNYAKMIFSCNELPMINTLSNAFWLRWVVIEFPYQFLPQHEIDSLDDKSNIFLQDENILQKIMNDEELSGLLNWAIEGLHRLEQTKKFTNETCSNNIKKYWLRKSNSVAAFIEDCIVTDYDSRITKQVFRKYYHDYCKKNNLKQMSEKAVKITLSNEMGLTDRYVKINDTQIWAWEGIKFNDNSKTNISETILNLFKKSDMINLNELKSIVTNENDLNKELQKLISIGVLYEPVPKIYKKTIKEEYVL
ncbi:MAG TPA: phage/plasmid primase, P4 family [Halanaerobiales bacterium]|nr:phage/plasmid primase, P4 family [Halanaerobiales bacterium]